MDYISTACDILSAIEETMDDEHFDEETITAKRFRISDFAFTHILDDLIEREYLGGIENNFNAEKFSFEITMYRPYLTLKGAEFLAKYRLVY